MSALTWDDAVWALRRSLAEASTNAKCFAGRAGAHAQLISARSWEELAAIEALLARDLADCLRLELHQEPWTLVTRTSAALRSARLAFESEAALIARLQRDLASHPVEAWREAAPQLEASLWPFFISRTHHLANTLALAQNEPQPYPAIFWHPHHRKFQRQRST